jgi:hypothetical protein
MDVDRQLANPLKLIVLLMIVILLYADAVDAGDYSRQLLAESSRRATEELRVYKGRV